MRNWHAKLGRIAVTALLIVGLSAWIICSQSPVNGQGSPVTGAGGTGGCSVTGFTSGHVITNDGAGNCTDAGFSGSNVVTATRSGTQTIAASGANLSLNVSSTGAQPALNVFPGTDLSTAMTVKNAAQTATLAAFDTTAGGNGLVLTPMSLNNAATGIVVGWVGGGTTTAKMSATIERVI